MAISKSAVPSASIPASKEAVVPSRTSGQIEWLAQHRAQRPRPDDGGPGAGLELASLDAAYDELSISFEDGRKILWCHQRHGERPCFSLPLLTDVLDLQTRLRNGLAGVTARESPLRYLVWASSTPGIYNLGGDLRLFTRLIRERDADGLQHYAKACIDICYLNTISLDLPILTIALVQGDTLGGGFEAALSNDIIIAEEGCQFGLPEVLFNLFPGMGAYSFLCRRLNDRATRQMVLSGKLYDARELHEMGVIDLLVPPGTGQQAVRDYIDRHDHRHAVIGAVARVARRCDPVTYTELHDVTQIWVETALGLSESDLRRMERLAAAQHRRRDRARLH